jgi:hypothetical protein
MAPVTAATTGNRNVRTEFDMTKRLLEAIAVPGWARRGGLAPMFDAQMDNGCGQIVVMGRPKGEFSDPD